MSGPASALQAVPNLSVTYPAGIQVRAMVPRSKQSKLSCLIAFSSRLTAILAGCLLALAGAAVTTTPQRAFAAATNSTSVTPIANPDVYTCSQSGFVGFESLTDGTALPGTIAGLDFVTTGGHTWLVGDFATGHYNGKYPNGKYTSQGTHWAWLGENQGSGRIDMANGAASYFSLLISVGATPVYLEAYDASGNLLATAGPATYNIETGHMTELKIMRATPDIAYVIVHDTGNFFLVDSLCTDAPGVTENPGLPGQPTSVLVTPQNGYAELSWNAPADQGSSMVTSYVIEAVPFANADVWASPSTILQSVAASPNQRQQGEITGLLEDCHQEYTFRVRAVNASGQGRPSDYGAAAGPNAPSPPNASGSPPHFRTSGIVATSEGPPVVVITVDGFGAHYNQGVTSTVDPLVGGGRATTATGTGPPVSYCRMGEQVGNTANASIPAAIATPNLHFDEPEGLPPEVINNDGSSSPSYHYLLDQLVAGGGIALPYSYARPAQLTGGPVPEFSFTGYSEAQSKTQSVEKDVAFLQSEVESIHKVWPHIGIIILGHSGGGLVSEQYWQTKNSFSQNVIHVYSIEGPINGEAATKVCYPDQNSFLCGLVTKFAGGYGSKVLWFLGKQWRNQQSNDQAILRDDFNGIFTAISTEGDSAYEEPQNGAYDPVVPDSVFGCDVTHDPSEIASCLPAQPPSFVDGGTFLVNDPCAWTSSIENAYGAGPVPSHFYAIVCRQNVDYVRSTSGAP